MANTKSANESATSEFEANIESYVLTSNAIIVFNKTFFMFSTMQICINHQQKNLSSFKAFDESVQMINERQDILPNR